MLIFKRKAFSLFILASAMLLPLQARAQSVAQFKSACDSVCARLGERTGVKSKFRVKKVAVSGSNVSFQFSKELGDYPWRPGDEKWFKDTFHSYFSSAMKKYSVGGIKVESKPLSDYVVRHAGNNGKPDEASFRVKDPGTGHPFISKVGGQQFGKGMTGRTIALWQSHGRYYNEDNDRWMWQRAPLFGTVEDMYTQTYVLPFLVPMLENAGAYVMTPRERDTQSNEVVADNDPSFTGKRSEGVRLSGKYSESGRWEDAGIGFADAKAEYSRFDNPFRMGTARKADCSDRNAKATWTPDIPKRGEYAVYISYKSLPNSTRYAHYSVKHLGATTGFLVNQKMGGGTWIYLGTFEFEEGVQGCVTLTPSAEPGFSSRGNECITADAVRFGGGIGKIARGPAQSPVNEYVTSGLPSFAEGSLYAMQWAGADSSLVHLHDAGDYTNDYGTRGAWVGWMSGGSRTNPDEEGLGIPVDMSFSFHTDAGVTPDDSIVGTLAIYTLKCDDKETLPNGEGRLQSRTYCDYVQTQAVEDVRAVFNRDWMRRGLWDRSYSESRTSTVPAMLLEFLSHQNFADMKYGLDPSFRFLVSRSIYKGMLKYLSARFGTAYAVQPLPVNSFSTAFTNDSGTSVRLSWKPTVDKLEPTADPSGYVLFTRVDDGGFDDGVVLDSFTSEDGIVSVDRRIAPGHIYSYRVVAFNEGGRSFPSEVLSIGVPEGGRSKNALVVNNFTRVAAPAWFESETIAGFDGSLDSGVPYGNEIGFIGDQFNFDRNCKWLTDDNPGFGASYVDRAAMVSAGNSFDYTMVHGRALMAAGYAFHSTGRDAFSADASVADGDSVLDLVCGKQVRTVVGRSDGEVRYTVFTEDIRKGLRSFASKGGNVLVSGSYIATDSNDTIYPFELDGEECAATNAFLEQVLGVKWATNHATRGGYVVPARIRGFQFPGTLGRMDFHQERNPEVYCVESPDGIAPAGKESVCILRYADTEVSAGICYTGSNYRAASFGFPIETLCSTSDIDKLILAVTTWFESSRR